MTDFFPFFEDVKEETSHEIPLYKEVAWDIKKNCPIIEDGSFKIVTGKEALKAWCYKSLQVKRYKYFIYSWDYGSELEDLIGSAYTQTLVKAECTRYIEECLMINPYILGIRDVKMTFKEGTLNVFCKLDTLYDEIEVEVML